MGRKPAALIPRQISSAFMKSSRTRLVCWISLIRVIREIRGLSLMTAVTLVVLWIQKERGFRSMSFVPCLGLLFPLGLVWFPRIRLLQVMLNKDERKTWKEALLQGNTSPGETQFIG